jgi:SAM-dependent methyltransferase
MYRKPRTLWAEPWMVWRENAWRELTCPACETTSLMPKRIDANPPYKPRERYNLFECEACGTLHYPDAEVFEYESRRDADLARKFYLEVGAGLDAMIAPLAWSARSDVGSFLEVGGGYGFSVDFASRELGWKATNIDPSFLARTGAADLGHAHVAAYLSPDHKLADQSFDRVLSSEVIEHVKKPDDFINALTAALAPDGVLLLTTPNAAVVKKGASLDDLLPVITAGHHLVIYSKAGLQAVLRRAGYSRIRIEESGPTLHAAAAREEFEVDFNARPDRSRLQSYLAGRLERLGKDHTLFAAFAVRLLKEYVHTGQWDEARHLRDRITRRWLEDYGFNLRMADSLKPDFVPGEKGQRRQLRKFAANHPFSLAIALYYSGRIDQQGGNTKQALGALLACARIATTMQTVFSAMYAACRETEEAGLRATLAAAEINASFDAESACDALLAIADKVEDLVRDEWWRVACHVYASNALSGHHAAVSGIEAHVRGWLEMARDERRALTPAEGYAAGGVGEHHQANGRPEQAARWFDVAATAMADPAEADVFRRKAAELTPEAPGRGQQLIDALNSDDEDTAQHIGHAMSHLPVTSDEIDASVAYALGIYHLNIAPDANAAIKWFARSAELANGDARLDAELHIALAAERLADGPRARILPDLIHQLEIANPVRGDLGSRIKELTDRYRAQSGAREETA